MKIDFHTHCKWSKQSELSPAYINDMLRAAGAHVDALALTEHFDTLHFEHILDWLEQHAQYEQERGYFRYEELRILPGMEVEVAEGGHILVIGRLNAIRSINQSLASHRTKETFIPLHQLLQLCDEQCCMRIGAHPFRNENPLFHVDADLLRRLDALDINGRDLYKYGSGMEQQVRKFAGELGLPVVGGSDTHHFDQYGCVYTELAAELTDVLSLRHTLSNQSYSCYVAEHLSVMVGQAERQQAAIKQAGGYKQPRHALK